MINRKKRKQDDYIGPQKGWAKFFHRLFLFLTFPLRKPWWTLAVLVVMFLAPTFSGIKPAEVHLWYWNLLKKSSVRVSDKAKTIIAEIPKVEVANVEPKSVKMAEVEKKSSGRKMFERAKSPPIVKTIQTSSSDVAAVSENDTDNEIVVEQQEPRVVNFEKPQVQSVNTVKENHKNLDLIYVDEPKQIEGMAIVITANEIKVGNTELFLHGIYVSPYSDKGKRAKVFLMDTISGKDVKCEVKAYTFQSVPTAICTIDGININKQLVDLGYSKNVALD